ncbi:hypothetical protein [Enterobacter hormaechei]|uniref:hypothetical protein n=1 Tax=Enterobacter hormaechei TaxID=158836 RepID=UPI0007929340|nr:hypothetical protein [Enterobacter hormaechei]WMA51897.1 hypothetical protein QPR81_17495 [Enterobacter hormaechei]SAD86003.1 Uncharacterised protein [Enterobacter hormaechei]
MESITKQLVNIGHGMSKEIAADEPAVAKLLVELSSALDVQYERGNALEAKCAALAAENAGLKSAIDATIGWQQSTDPENVESVRMLVDVKTPATDAFLAEVRAAAVDEVCLKISNAIVNCYQDEQVGLDAAATICGDFAAQLRKGVQS